LVYVLTSPRSNCFLLEQPIAGLAMDSRILDFGFAILDYRREAPANPKTKIATRVSASFAMKIQNRVIA
jgi:hypothetical protein